MTKAYNSDTLCRPCKCSNEKGIKQGLEIQEDKLSEPSALKCGGCQSKHVLAKQRRGFEKGLGPNTWAQHLP